MSELPEGWVETTLGEVATISSSKRIFHADYVQSGIPFYRSKEIIEKQKGNKISSELFITEEKFNAIRSKYGSPEKTDLLLTSVGTLGIPYLVQENEVFYFKDGNLTWFRDYKNIEPLLLYYFFLSSIGKERLNEITIGSTQSALTIIGLKTIPINLPLLPEQKAITGVLSAFDEKIELLREQNETLETIAQTLYSEKLKVNSEKLEGIKITEFIEFNPVEKINRKNEYLFFDMKTIQTNSMALLDGMYKKSNSGSSFREGDTLLAKITPCLENGKTGFVLDLKGEEIARGSTEFIVMRAKENSSPFLNYCLSRSPHFRDYAIKSMTGTSGRQRVQLDRLKSYKIKISQEDIQSLDTLLYPIFKKIKNNTAQIQTLSKTRDTLLPKLMSGEVRTAGFEQ